MTKPSVFLALAAFIGPATIISPAAIISFDLDSSGSDPIGVNITLDDMTTPGSLMITAQIQPKAPNAIGDLRGLWVDLTPTAAAGLSIPGHFTFVSLAGLQVPPNSTVTPVLTPGNSIGPGNNVNGASISPTFTGDVAFLTSAPGIGKGKGDIQTAVFILDGLATDDVLGVAARVTSVGTGENREGSDKLFGDTPEFPPPPTGEEPVPEPASLTLMAGGLLALAWAGRRRQQRQ